MSIGSIGSNYSNYSSYGKIASGNKLPTAADGAAELAINEKMETQQRTAKAAMRGSSEKIDQLNISDGTLEGITDYLQDIRQNAIYSKNGTLTAGDREDISKVNSQLMKGIGQQLDSKQMESLGLKNLDVSDVDAIDEALKNVNKQRADLGAYQNRFELAGKGINVAAENMTASESKIRDADIASEMVEYTKDQILLQSATAMLAQANSNSQNVLSLLK